MKAIFIVLCFAAIAFAADIIGTQDFIDEINSKQKLWVAGPNPIGNLPRDEARRLLGTKIELKDKRDHNHHHHNHHHHNHHHHKPAIKDLPEEFDSRKIWPDCPTIKEIRNQRHCGSCWAFGAVEAMSDRVCIANGKTVRLSAEDMNSCAHHIISCGSCDGGRPGCAWSYWVKSGVVSEDCYPYTAGTTNETVTPKCLKKCTNNTSLEWDSDKVFGKRSYSLSGEEDIMAEVAEHGPIEVAFMVYSDFMTYTSGIYKHTSGSMEGGHAVKLLGWGIEDGVKYWICANSWDVTWGEQGFFRIIRGQDECFIESQAWGGIPL